MFCTCLVTISMRGSWASLCESASSWLKYQQRSLSSRSISPNRRFLQSIHSKTCYSFITSFYSQQQQYNSDTPIMREWLMVPWHTVFGGFYTGIVNCWEWCTTRICPCFGLFCLIFGIGLWIWIKPVTFDQVASLEWSHIIAIINLCNKAQLWLS